MNDRQNNDESMENWEVRNIPDTVHRTLLEQNLLVYRDIWEKLQEADDKTLL